MAALYTFTTDAINPFEDVTVRSFSCRKITLFEDGGLATADIQIQDVNDALQIATYPAGAKIELRPSNGSECFVKDMVICRIAAASGSLTVVQIED